jgi:hypothetical protein
VSVGTIRKAAVGGVAVLALIPPAAGAATAAATVGVHRAKAAAAKVAPAAQRVSAGAADRYPNGRIPTSALCSIGQGGHRLRCDAAADFRRLSAAYAVRFGGPLQVTDSYRSFAAQVECRRIKGYLCAVPGTSNHGRGRAVDMAGPGHLCGTTEHRWLEANAGRFGWLWPSWARPTGSKTECWHWQYRTES